MIRTMTVLLLLAFSVGAFAEAEAQPAANATVNTTVKKKIIYRKKQKVSFDGMDVDGKSRTPDGVYVNEKRGVDFMPLFQNKNNFSDKIIKSVEHLR